MKKPTLTNITCTILVSIFVYTGVNKLTEISNFQAVLSKSTFLKPIYIPVSWIIPSIEIVTALVLAFAKSKIIGLWIAVILLTMFTVYISGMLALLHHKDLPCSCGGIINKLSWPEHVILNLALLTLSSYTLYRIKSNKLLPAGNGEPVLRN